MQGLSPQNIAPPRDNGTACIAVIEKDLSGNGDHVVGGPPGRRFEVLDCWFVATNSVGAALTVKNGSDNISDAMSKSTTPNTLTRAGAVEQANADIVKGSDLVASFASAGDPSARLYVLILIKPGVTRT